MLDGEPMPDLRDIERVIRRQLPREVVPGFEAGAAPSASFVDTPAPRDARPATPRGQPRRENGGRADSRGTPHGKPRAPAQKAGGRTTQARDARPAGQPKRDGKPAAQPRSDAPRPDAAPSARPGRPQHRRDEPPGNVRSNLPPGWK